MCLLKDAQKACLLPCLLYFYCVSAYFGHGNCRPCRDEIFLMSMGTTSRDESESEGGRVKRTAEANFKLMPNNAQ